LIAGEHHPQDFPLRSWGDPNPVLQSTMHEMFPMMSPFLHENF